MFRTVIINKGEHISVKENWLVVQTDEGEKSIPLTDIYSVVIDNQASNISVPAIHRLTTSGAHILICDEKHIPVSVILPQNTHYHPLTIIRRQIEMDDDFKDELWDRIVRSKIENQAKVLELCGCRSETANRLRYLRDEVCDGDNGNREGIAARLFFHALYGSDFIRHNDDGINAALNYGYAIIRSSVCKTLCGYGYNSVIGIHHISESDPFNLAEDIMEPYRPIVDMWVDDYHGDITDTLSRNQRKALASLVNNTVLINGKKKKIRNAIDDTVCSLTTAIIKRNPDSLVLPQMIRTGIYQDDSEETE